MFFPNSDLIKLDTACALRMIIAPSNNGRIICKNSTFFTTYRWNSLSDGKKPPMPRNSQHWALLPSSLIRLLMTSLGIYWKPANHSRGCNQQTVAKAIWTSVKCIAYIPYKIWECLYSFHYLPVLTLYEFGKENQLVYINIMLNLRRTSEKKWGQQLSMACDLSNPYVGIAPLSELQWISTSRNHIAFTCMGQIRWMSCVLQSQMS